MNKFYVLFIVHLLTNNVLKIFLGREIFSCINFSQFVI